MPPRADMIHALLTQEALTTYEDRLVAENRVIEALEREPAILYRYKLGIQFYDTAHNRWRVPLPDTIPVAVRETLTASS